MFRKIFENTQISGSIAEGAVMVRNLKSNLPEEYIETEVDPMCSPGKILKSRSRETIIDLPYAKGLLG